MTAECFMFAFGQYHFVIEPQDKHSNRTNIQLYLWVLSLAATSQLKKTPMAYFCLFEAPLSTQEHYF